MLCECDALMSRVLLLNGPNLNLLGTREPGLYGAETLAEIETRGRALAQQLGIELTCFQSNSEAELIDRIQQAPAAGIGFLIFNPGGLTHTSVALRHAILAVQLPFIEVHLSNIAAREDFRRRSYFSDIALGMVSGLGALGYECALRAAARELSRPKI